MQTRILVGAVLSLIVVGCSGSSSNPQTPPPPPPPPPPAPISIKVPLEATQVVGGSAETGSAEVTVSIDPIDLSVTGWVTLNGLDAVDVTMNRGNVMTRRGSV